VNNNNVVKILKLAVTLAIICIVAGGALALTYAVTEKQIAKQAKEEEMESNKEALPFVKKSDDFKARDDLAAKARKKYKDVVKIYEGYKNGEKIGWVVQVAPRGYGGPLRFAVGIDTKGKVTGISIIEIKETPGLGLNVEKPEFQRQFKGKDVSEPFQVGKDIDALTGATISSKAMALGVREALQASETLGAK
jgi:electron transport complex protein RnfG